MNNNNDLSELFSSQLLKDYLKMNDELIRIVVTGITSEGERLKAKSFEGTPISDEPDRILSLCRRLMQISELYSNLTAAVTDDTARTTLELSDFIRGFACKCREYLGKACNISAECSEIPYLNIPKEMLIYILLSYVRAAVLGGAEEISFSAFKELERCCITADVKYGGSLSESRFADFAFAHNDEILKFLAEKLSAEYESSEHSIKLSFRADSSSSEAELRSERQNYESEAFSIYGVMLGDLGHAPNGD